MRIFKDVVQGHMLQGKVSKHFLLIIHSSFLGQESGFKNLYTQKEIT